MSPTANLLVHEVLVVDSDQKVQRGLAQLLAEIDLEARIVSDPEHAREIAKTHPFAVALIDFDTPEPGAGLVLIDGLHRELPALPIVALISARDFDSGLAAFRAGCSDVVLKAPEQLDYLRRRVHELSQGPSTHRESDLTPEILSVQAELLGRLMESARQVAELTESRGAEAGEAHSECALLVVDGDDWLLEPLNAALAEQRGFFLRRAATGGEGMDVATGGRFQIALVNEVLADLPGTMVASALRGQSPDLVTAVFSKPGARPGKVDLIEGSRTRPLISELNEPRQLVERLGDLRDAAQKKGRERRYLAAFRQQNYDLLRRYAELKQRLTARR